MTSLSNSDFRSLLNETDASVLRTKTKRKNPEGAFDAKKESRRLKYQKLHRLAKQQNKANRSNEAKSENVEGSDEEDADLTKYPSAYKDRARARRFGAEEYAQVAAEFEANRERSVDESKYFGGDESHTHLVKGLDFSLLSKVRAQLQKTLAQEASIKAEAQGEKKKTAEKLAASRSAVASRLSQLFATNIHPHQIDFHSKLHRIEKVILQGAKFRGNTQNFQPGRMIFEYKLPNADEDENDDSEDDFGNDPIPSEKPIVVFHSKNDCAQRSKTETTSGIGTDGSCFHCPPYIIKELQDIVQWHSQNAKNGPKRPSCRYTSLNQKQRINLEVATARRIARAAECTASDNIFPDAGTDYDASRNASLSSIGVPSRTSGNSVKSQADNFFADSALDADSSDSDADEVSAKTVSKKIAKSPPREPAVSLQPSTSAPISSRQPGVQRDADAPLQQRPKKLSEVVIQCEDDINVDGYDYWDDSDDEAPKRKPKAAKKKNESAVSSARPAGGGSRTDELGRRHESLF